MTSSKSRVVLGLTSVLALSLPLLLAAPRPRAPISLDVPVADAADSGFKDLQVLPKNISKAELKAIMKQQSKALGVDCDHCHKQPNMDAPTTNKTAAREMMQMTTAINATYKNTMKKVTCWTCHRGQSHPAEMPK